jgi:hypothetical protein
MWSASGQTSEALRSSDACDVAQAAERRLAMSCQFCQPAYDSGKRNGERDGRLAVAKELTAFGGAIADKAARLITEGKLDDAKRLASSASAVSEFAQNLVARVQQEFG